MKNIAFAAAIALCSLISISSAQAGNTTFAEPKVGAQRLDLCLNWGSGCGKPAADAWCVSKGFDTSSSHVVASDIGAATPTRVFSTGALCDQGFCDGFASVTCFKAAPTTQAYIKPKHMGNRLDLCVDWAVGRGKPAADKYCQAKGWNTSINHVVANDIGASSPTRLIGTGAVCDQGFCDGFQRITCSN